MKLNLHKVVDVKLLNENGCCEAFNLRLTWYLFYLSQAVFSLPATRSDFSKPRTRTLTPATVREMCSTQC